MTPGVSETRGLRPVRPRVAARGCTAAAGFPESLPISVQPPAAAAPRTAGSQRARHERVTSHRACCVRRAAVARRRQWSYGPLCTESLLLLTRPSFPLLPSPLATGTGVVTPPRPLTCVALGGMQTAGLTHAAAPRLSRGRSARRQTAAACAVVPAATLADWSSTQGAQTERRLGVDSAPPHAVAVSTEWTPLTRRS